MSILFERDISVSSNQIKNIFFEGLLLEYISCAFFTHTANYWKVYNAKYYILDVVISVGYFVKSKEVFFLQRASNIIQDYLIKSYAINVERSLKTIYYFIPNVNI